MITKGAIKYLLFAFTILLIAASDGSEFQRLLANPFAYHKKRVCLVGFAHVEGESFVLYENAKAAAQFSDSRAVSVAQQIGGSSYDRLNNRWVKIVGIVDAHSHGLWNLPCEILLERAEVAKQPQE
jgi:hypothetical protein